MRAGSTGQPRSDRARPRVVLWGDGESPHLAKWGRALAPRVDLFLASSRGFAPALADLVAPARRLALGRATRFRGGNASLLLALPALVRWLKAVDADWINAHYLTSHGTLAWLARRAGIDARLAASAWGSDILVAPRQSAVLRWLTRRVLRDAEVCTSDSRYMADRMRAYGAREVMTFPFGLEALPPPAGSKEPELFFANRGLEPVYDPARVLAVFAGIARTRPGARLVVANDGSLRAALESRCGQLGLADRVRFVGRLDAATQAACYARATWYLSLPRSDSVSVSVLEAMAHGCVPLLSDLPANRELVTTGEWGIILADGDDCVSPGALDALGADAPRIARRNRAWVDTHAMFGPAVDQFVQRLGQGAPGR